MGKIYCSECGAETNDSALFCQECGSKIDNDTPNNNLMLNANIDINKIMERVELPLLIKSIFAIVIIEAVSFSFIWVGVSFSLRIVPLLFNILAIFGVIICPFIMGYLSQESILFSIGYAVLMAIMVFFVYFIFAPFGFMGLFGFLFMLIVMIAMAFIGKYAQTKNIIRF